MLRGNRLLATTWAALGAWTLSAGLAQAADPSSKAPKSTAKPTNVVLIITDDQGYGDLGLHGNPRVRTPHLDGLAQAGMQLEQFHVSPVCTPTRASLMTGRYNYRTCAIDTFNGRAMMHPDETTVAEMLSAAGYRTGIFGKWHLGDNHPMRPMDQGFQESLIHKGGGIGQSSDPPGGSRYLDPVLFHNGKAEPKRGYCSDLYTDAALEFIQSSRSASKPFFVYLAFNCPHTPLEAPAKSLEDYRDAKLGADQFPQAGQPIGKTDEETTRKIYAMVSNIDDNVGRLLARLDEWKLADDTLVIFLTDNGPQQPRYNAGMRGLKTTVYQGGIRVPCFVRWPGRIAAGSKSETLAAHIDLTPSILEACGVQPPANVKLDGRSLLPLWEQKKVDWPVRTLYFQWHRGDEPQLYRNFAARESRYKLVQASGAWQPEGERLELYDMVADPFEQRDVAAEQPDVVARIKAGYEAWFKDVGNTRGYAPPKIYLGTPHENPVELTRQDARQPAAGAKQPPFWEVDVRRAGKYEVAVRVAKTAAAGAVSFALGDLERSAPLDAGGALARFTLDLPAGPARLSAWWKAAEGASPLQPAHYVELRIVE